jgi:hypothetical protein
MRLIVKNSETFLQPMYATGLRSSFESSETVLRTHPFRGPSKWLQNAVQTKCEIKLFVLEGLFARNFSSWAQILSFWARNTAID